MKYVTSAPDAQWVEKQAQALDGAAQLSLTGERFQTVRGFGGCFNELSAIALQKLDDAQRAQVMDALFDADAGCNFKVCRVPIGAPLLSTSKDFSPVSLAANSPGFAMVAEQQMNCGCDP